MVQTDEMVNDIKPVRFYMVMITMEEPDGRIQGYPFSKKYHKTRFEAFLEMEHAKDDPRYAGEIFYIKEV